MTNRTDIAWTQYSWNPLRGCSRVSAGCMNCYAERQAMRMSAPGQAYHGLVRLTSQGPKWTGEIAVVGERLLDPARWTRPRLVFVNSMSDLFHERVPEAFIDQVFAVMTRFNAHTFQVLTKRADRMAEYMLTPGRARRMLEQAMQVSPPCGITDVSWPPPNVWFGVSVEDQAAADDRIPLLLATPAAVRWISAEPLLGPLDALGEHGLHGGPGQLDWVVVGGESGPGARSMVLGWAKTIVRHCRAAGVPVFVKQLGAHPINREGEPHPVSDRAGKVMADWPEELRVQEWPK